MSVSNPVILSGSGQLLTFLCPLAEGPFLQGELFSFQIPENSVHNGIYANFFGNLNVSSLAADQRPTAFACCDVEKVTNKTGCVNTTDLGNASKLSLLSICFIVCFGECSCGVRLESGRVFHCLKMWREDFVAL